MSRFVVIREAAAGWIAGRGALEQPELAEHSAFMNELAEQGFLLLAGPLAGSELDRIRALLIVEADDEAEIAQRLAGDPWAHANKLKTVSVASWNVFVGGERLAPRGQSALAYFSAEPASNS
jgi:uncharacterized protein YciI